MKAERTGETSEDGQRRNTAEQPPPLVAEERRKKSLRVLVAVDESDVSLYALKWTLEHLFKTPVAAAAVTPDTLETIPDPEQGMVTVAHVMEPFERYTFPAEPCPYFSLFTFYHFIFIS